MPFGLLPEVIKLYKLTNRPSLHLKYIMADDNDLGFTTLSKKISAMNTMGMSLHKDILSATLVVLCLYI